MNYKIGDKVLLYSWDELLKKFKYKESEDTMYLPYGFAWMKTWDNELPQNRIVTIKSIKNEKDMIKITKKMYYGNYIFKCMIKGYTNEYYLQQIKGEL